MNHTVHYFGGTWDAPLFDPRPGVTFHRDDTSATGAACFYCTEDITEGDRGLYQHVARDTAPGQPLRAAPEPIHAECYLRSVIGSPAHLRGECSCRGRTEPHHPGSVRDEAREVVNALNADRARAGMGPLWHTPGGDAA